MPGGNVGRGVILDLSALDALAWTDQGRIRAGAGVIALAADEFARDRDHHLPALPSSAPACTVGGMVATNASGARSFRFGATHAWTSALRVVRAGGTAELHERGATVTDPFWDRLRAEIGSLGPFPPPAVRKNSSGYAVARFLASGSPIDLLAGSEGTLAVVTEVTFDPRPLPEGRAVVLVGVPDPDVLPPLAALAESAGATACEFFGRRFLELGGLMDDARLAPLDRSAGIVLLELAGSDDTVAEGLALLEGDALVQRGRVRATLPEEVDALWGLRHAASPAIAAAAGPGRRSLQFIEDGVVPLAALPAYLRGVEAALADHDVDGVIFGHAGEGNLHVNPLVEIGRIGWRETVRALLADVTELVVALGGTPTGEHGDGRLRAPLLDRVWDERHRRAFRRVKDTLDPQGILNPGVILPEPGQDALEGLAAGPDLQRVVAGVGRVG